MSAVLFVLGMPVVLTKNVDDFLQRARNLRKMTAAHPISDEALDEAIAARRP
jgi:hypothetical protein